MSDTQKHILIVEDDDLIAKLYQASLVDSGLHIQLETDGDSGWQALQAQIPDLVILDIMLPKLSGLDLLEKMRADERLKVVPVIMLSSLSSESDKARALAAGANAYWVKNEVDMPQFSAQIKSFLP